MTGLTLGKIAVVEIEIANQCSIEQGRSIGSRPTAPDQCAIPCASEVFDLFPNQSYRFARERTDRACHSIEDPDFEVITNMPAEGVV